jgi:radical SAM protein with 4Fe4S-binding SPASM domain
MNGIAARSLGYGAGLLTLVVLGWILTEQAAGPAKHRVSLPTDWSHRHVVFSNPTTAEEYARAIDEPRYWQRQQMYRRNFPAAPVAMAPLAKTAPSKFKGTLHRDWAVDLGGGVESIQISIYSHRPEVHDAITLVPGSLQRSLDAARFLKSQGLRVIFANVLMVQNLQDYQGVRVLAEELGVECTLDPTITPMMDGDRSVLSLGVKQEALRQVFRDQALVGDVDEFCTVAAPADENELAALPCSAGHTTCYVSPYGDVFPCVQFPLPTGNVRNERFVDIWRHSERMNEVRSIRLKDLTTCTSCSHVESCTRCPGLAFMEGNMRGPSSQDCEKSFARTGIPSANMLAKKTASRDLLQIRIMPDNSAQPTGAIA